MVEGPRNLTTSQIFNPFSCLQPQIGTPLPVFRGSTVLSVVSQAQMAQDFVPLGCSAISCHPPALQLVVPVLECAVSSPSLFGLERLSLLKIPFAVVLMGFQEGATPNTSVQSAFVHQPLLDLDRHSLIQILLVKMRKLISQPNGSKQ